jgi:hypothetical protein
MDVLSVMDGAFNEAIDTHVEDSVVTRIMAFVKPTNVREMTAEEREQQAQMVRASFLANDANSALARRLSALPGTVAW